MLFKKRIYLDTAAGVAGNPSSPHENGRAAKKKLEEARRTIARLLEVQSDDIIFTSGATESNALAILGTVRAARLLAGPDTAGRNNIHVLYLPSAHASIVENVQALTYEGVVAEALPITDFRVDTDRLAKMIRKETLLVSMDAVCGETGVIWNTREVAEVLRKFRTDMLEKRSAQSAGSTQHPFGGAPVLHVDASQAPWTEKITREHFGADLLTLDASKVSSVRGCGVLAAHRTLPLVPLYGGGGQERGVRPGTESPDLAHDFAEALTDVVSHRDAFRASAKSYREQLVSYLTKKIKDLSLQEGRAQAPHIVNLSLPGRDTDYVVALLDEAGFSVATRSACETDSEEGSRAVFALTGDREKALSTLRISWGPATRSRELVRFGKELVASVAFIDSNRQR